MRRRYLALMVAFALLASGLIAWTWPRYSYLQVHTNLGLYKNSMRHEYVIRLCRIRNPFNFITVVKTVLKDKVPLAASLIWHPYNYSCVNIVMYRDGQELSQNSLAIEAFRRTLEENDKKELRNSINSFGYWNNSINDLDRNKTLPFSHYIEDGEILGYDNNYILFGNNGETSLWIDGAKT